MKRLLSPFPRNRPPNLLMYEPISKAAGTNDSIERNLQGSSFFV